MRFRGFQLFYENEETTQSMIRAIDDFPTFFAPNGEQPLIIDCGANIGISVLEWKYRWPMCRVICFEPDPFAYKLLEQNLEKNDVPGVQSYQAAISDQDGESILYGEIGRGSDSRGNSLHPDWGKRKLSQEVKIQCLRLGPYLDQEPVAFLKLDIEGKEESVLKDISPKLERVQAAYVEVHETKAMVEYNSASRVEKILRDAEFNLELERRFQKHSLPKAQFQWQEAVDAQQTQIMCWR